MSDAKIVLPIAGNSQDIKEFLMSIFADNFAETFAKQLKSMIERTVQTGKKSRKKKILLKEDVFENSDVTKISVSTASADIAIEKSTNSNFHIKVFSTERDDSKKFEIEKSLNDTSLDFRLLEKENHNLSLKIFLPENQLDITVFSENGDISVSSILQNSFSLKTENGDIVCKMVSCDSITAKSVNGDIVIEKCKTKKTIKASSQNGDVIK